MKLLVEITHESHMQTFYIRLFKNPTQNLDDCNGMQIAEFKYGEFHTREQAMSFACRFGEQLAKLLECKLAI